MNHINKLIELITLLEERSWQYCITHEDRFELHIGNEFVEFSKFNVEAIEDLIEEITLCW